MQRHVPCAAARSSDSIVNLMRSTPVWDGDHNRQCRPGDSSVATPRAKPLFLTPEEEVRSSLEKIFSLLFSGCSFATHGHGARSGRPRRLSAHTGLICRNLVHRPRMRLSSGLGANRHPTAGVEVFCVLCTGELVVAMWFMWQEGGRTSGLCGGSRGKKSLRHSRAYLSPHSLRTDSGAYVKRRNGRTAARGT